MIAAEEITKTFKLYPRPRDYLLERLGFGRRHREIHALTGVSLRAEAGECLGIVGANGAGKSTLLRVLAGISPPSSGRLRSEGRVSAILELDSGFHPEFTGRENIRVGAAILGMGAEEARSREAEVIAFSGLAEFIDLPVRTYSSGMYLRLGFALATAVNPDVLLVDEALAVGDEWFRGRCVDRIMAIRERGAAVVIVSHDLTLVRALCDRAVLLDHGRAAAEGPALAVINQYLDRIYAAAAAEAGRETKPGERPRRGSGEVEITAVRLLGPDGRPTGLLRTGEALTVEIDYRARAEIVSPLFGINIFRADGVLAVCTNSEAGRDANAKYRPGEPAGDQPERIAAGRQGTAAFRVERNPLLSGDYELSVNVYRGRSGAHLAVDELLGVARFQVASADHAERGLFLCEGRWSIG